MDDHEVRSMTRRGFLRAGAAVPLAAMVPVGAAGATTAPAGGGIPRRRLGRTGLEVSRVSFGSWNLSNPRLVDAAIDAGMNLIQTCSDYQNGRAEKTIGQVMKRRRKEVVLGTGWLVEERTTVGQLLKQLDGSLRRLQTDHVELIRAHNLRRTSQLDNEALYEAFEKARGAGKVGHLGLSVHSRGSQQAILDKAIGMGRISYVMAKYNFMEFGRIMEIFERAFKAGVGVVVFKTGAGERQKEMEELRARERLSLKQAAIRWALSNPHVVSVLATIRNFQQVKEFAAAGRGGLTTKQSSLLERYRRRFDGVYCRYCGGCGPACPAGVEIDEVMRYAMYHDFYGMGKEARRLYAGLPARSRAAACLSCAGYCVGWCPHGLDIRGQLVAAHSRLSGGLA